mmetsp:Transcript_8552/g.14742  ORF Transcript_8552/g.14742 Transcript_8552/m.14742 type:complete len:393 (-) Transcript_8552:407-1585(-)
MVLRSTWLVCLSTSSSVITYTRARASTIGAMFTASRYGFSLGSIDAPDPPLKLMICPVVGSGSGGVHSNAPSSGVSFEVSPLALSSAMTMRYGTIGRDMGRMSNSNFSSSAIERGSVSGICISVGMSMSVANGLISYSNSTKYSGSTSAWLNTYHSRCLGSVAFIRKTELCSGYTSGKMRMASPLGPQGGRLGPPLASSIARFACKTFISCTDLPRNTLVTSTCPVAHCFCPAFGEIPAAFCWSRRICILGRSLRETELLSVTAPSPVRAAYSCGWRKPSSGTRCSSPAIIGHSPKNRYSKLRLYVGSLTSTMDSRCSSKRLRRKRLWMRVTCTTLRPATRCSAKSSLKKRECSRSTHDLYHRSVGRPSSMRMLPPVSSSTSSRRTYWSPIS